MKTFPALLRLAAAFLVCLQGLAEERDAPAHPVPARLELRDQYDAPRLLVFPRTNLTLLVIADKKGSEQIAGWVAPVSRRFGGRIEVWGLADLSAVPGPLRGLVRKRFQKSQTHPVLLDWSGDAVRQFGYAQGKAEILLLNPRGQILLRRGGEAGGREVEELCGAIDRALAGATPGRD